jgi:Ankyrin repeats (3 copies)
LLLDKGADINAQGGEYGNALQAASTKGHEVVVRLLLDKGADVNAQGGLYSNALQAAWAQGHEVVVQLLLDEGADVNAQGESMATPCRRPRQRATRRYRCWTRGRMSIRTWRVWQRPAGGVIQPPRGGGTAVT